MPKTAFENLLCASDWFWTGEWAEGRPILLFNKGGYFGVNIAQMKMNRHPRQPA